MRTSEKLLLARSAGLLRNSRRTLSVAESCTGGMLGMFLTNEPGASDWFVGGVIAYSDGLKRELLGVDADTLNRCGAVSRETAFMMASGVRDLTGSDLSLAVTGIAGPTGGTPEKPVGSVWMALCHGEDCEAWSRRFEGDRDDVRRKAVISLLEHLVEYLSSGIE